jgi:hypothetical protein
VKNFGARAGTGVAASAAAMAILSASSVFPYGYPWPSVALGVLACAVLAGMVVKAAPQKRTIFDVISDVDAERAAVRR